MIARDAVNILLVDDQPARLLSYDAILGDLGQKLVHASSGVEALERLMKDEFAVIVLDVSMPGMSGFETAALIHEHPRFEKTPIIFVTGLHVTDLDRLKGYELGAVDYVYIPVVPQILRSKIAVLVELHCKRRELQALNRSLERANAELAAANSTLQTEKTRELQKLNEVLEAANAELAQANQTLQSEMAARERLEQALREAARRKDEFLAMLAHELRNPLAPILNAALLLRDKTKDDPDTAWCREVIERQTGHLKHLVDDLLDVSRLTQGKINLHKEPLELKTVIEHALEANRSQIDAREHELVLDLPPEPARVLGDLTRLTQVVGNLISNAAKYTERGGRIGISVARVQAPSGAQVVIRVTDSGVGISPAMLPRVFDLFTQVDQTLDRAQGGLGIGLALVQRLVSLHDGTVAAHSAGEGRGSEFVVTLPAIEDAAAPARSIEPMGSGNRMQISALSRRVLVADDNVDSAQSLAMLLELAGNRVELARDGIDAVEIAEKFRPEVVFCDIGMPRLDGYGTARRIRARAWGGDVFLIALTGWGGPEIRERTRDAGFNAHFVKPVDFAILAKLLADLPVGTSCLVE